MKNQSISDFVASTMDSVLNSKEHKSLFANQYKMASKECGCSGECDCSMADDLSFSDDENDARKKKKESKECGCTEDCDCSSADDVSNMKSSAAFDVAIDSLLTASAALDSVGLDRGSALTLKIASLVVEAKKEDKKKKDKKKSSTDSKSDKNKKSTKKKQSSKPASTLSKSSPVKKK